MKILKATVKIFDIVIPIDINTKIGLVDKGLKDLPSSMIPCSR